MTIEQWFPAKRGILKLHHDRRYDYFDYGFHTLPVIKHLKVKFLSDWGPSNKILSNGGPYSTLCQFRGL